jgi:hypothetical protein
MTDPAGRLTRPPVRLGSDRWGEARATWRRVRDGKASVRGYRTTAWRHTRFAAVYVAGAVVLLLLVLNVLK